MPFPPIPLRITCNQCHHSITWSPGSDALTPQEGFALMQCTQCGSEDIEREKLSETHNSLDINPLYSWLKKQLGK